MNQHLSVQLLTSFEVIATFEASMVSIPGENGITGILPGHCPLIANINAGLVSIITAKGDSIKYFIHKAIAKVDPLQVNFVSEFALEVSSKNISYIKNNLEILRKKSSATQVDEYLESSILHKIRIYETFLQFV